MRRSPPRRLSPGSAAAGAGVLRRAVRLTAARTGLQAACGGRGREAQAAEGRREPEGSSSKDLDEGGRRLGALCAWYAGHNTSMTDSDMIQMAEEYGSIFDEPTLSFYHLLAGVRLGGAEAGAAAAGATTTTTAELQAAVSRWLEHHAREGFDHLVLCVDGLDGRRVEAVRRAADAVLAGGGGGKAGDATHARHRYVGTTYGVVRCGDVEEDKTAKGPRKGLAAAVAAPLLHLTGGGGTAGGVSAFARLASRARWSVLLPELRHYVSATRGTARSVVLSLEAALSDAGALCLPVVAWWEACRAGSSPGHNCHALPRAVRAADCVRLAAMPSLGYGKLYTSGGEELSGPGTEAYGSGDDRGDKDRPRHARRALLKDQEQRVDDQKGGRDTAAAGGADGGAADGGASELGSEAILRQQHRLEVRQLPTRVEAEGAGMSVEECAARTLMLARY